MRTRWTRSSDGLSVKTPIRSGAPLGLMPTLPGSRFTPSPSLTPEHLILTKGTRPAHERAAPFRIGTAGAGVIEEPQEPGGAVQDRGRSRVGRGGQRFELALDHRGAEQELEVRHRSMYTVVVRRHGQLLDVRGPRLLTSGAQMGPEQAVIGYTRCGGRRWRRRAHRRCTRAGWRRRDRRPGSTISGPRPRASRCTVSFFRG